MLYDPVKTRSIRVPCFGALLKWKHDQNKLKNKTTKVKKVIINRRWARKIIKPTFCKYQLTLIVFQDLN